MQHAFAFYCHYVQACAYPHVCALISKCVCVQSSNQVIAHIPNAHLDLDHYEFCSQYVAEEVIDRAGNDPRKLLLQLLYGLGSTGLASRKRASGARSQLFKMYLMRYFLPIGGMAYLTPYDQGEKFG